MSRCSPASPITPASPTTPTQVPFFPYSPSQRAGSGEEPAPTKFVIVTGGTISGLGKGTAISSIGVALKSHGLSVTSIKIDPYLNIDAGTMSPFEHGEVYVLEDGGEVDLDLGNYERFLDVTLTSRHSITSGKIYDKVIKRERQGAYLGKTVQMVPHVTNAIQDWIREVAEKPVDKSGARPDVCLVELGGTVGDIESAVYMEALQQMQFQVGKENFLMAHVGFLPCVGATGEQKTKPVQHSVKLLREAGIKPDLLLCRSEQPVEDATRRKLSLFCQVPPSRVISLHDISNLYRVPLLLVQQNVGTVICEHFGFGLGDGIWKTVPLTDAAMPPGARDERLGDWRVVADRLDSCKEPVSIAIIGKYTGLHDSYLSVIKALKHASIEADVGLKMLFVESSDLELNTKSADPSRYDAAWESVKSAKGVLVPGGFGDRGIEGKIAAANYCRNSKVPYLGICVGLQTAVIGFAREVLSWEHANSTEFDEATPHPVVVFMPEGSKSEMGGTMRLGSRATILKDRASLGSRLYGGQSVVYERHRHRYEVNPQCVPALESQGLVFSGQDDRATRMEICEVPDHPFFIAVQYHPEFKSRPAQASPPFLGLLLASAGKLEERLEADGGVLKVGAGFDRTRSAKKA